MARLRLATTWLGGCSGCHMSFLDMDEWLIDLAEKADIVYTPFQDVKQFPKGVDVTLVEGAVAAAGVPGDVVRDEKVIEGYLGRG